MTKFALVYGTTEGHTKKISDHVANRLRAHGHDVHLHHAAELDDDFALDDFDAVIVGGSVYEGRHQKYIRAFAKERAGALEKMPSAFFSVGLSRVTGGREAAEKPFFAFVEETGWDPVHVGLFAGALKYTQYAWWKRALMKALMSKSGGETDTSRDYEYTDWDEVDAFTDAFADEVTPDI